MYLVYLQGCYLATEALCPHTFKPKHGTVGMYVHVAHHQVLGYGSFAKPDSHTKCERLVSQDSTHGIS